MSRKHILIWDNHPNEANKIENSLKSVMKVHDWDISITKYFTPYTEFHEILLRDHSSFDLLIVDCMENEDIVANQALSALKRINSNIKVIVTSIYQPELFETLPDKYHKDKCKAILKTILLSDDKERGIEAILSELLYLNKNSEGITRSIQINIDDNIYLNYLVEMLGGIPSIKQIIMGLSENLGYDINSSKFHIKAISQGLSGAVVFNLGIEDNNQNYKYRFIKISSNKNLIINELSKIKAEYQNIPENYKLTYLNTDPIRVNNYYILTAILAENSFSIRKYLISDTNGGSSIELINELMNECLAHLYHKNKRLTSNGQILHSILSVMDVKRISFLNVAIQELELLIGKNDDLIIEIKSLSKLMEKTDTFYERDNFKNIIIHGDLNGNNILVNEKNKLFLIDPTNMIIDHWARDISRLIVDLFAYGIDLDTKEYYGISNINTWKELGIKIVKGIPINSNYSKPGIIKSINWLSENNNLAKVFKELYEPWEFQLTLGLEFLRISYKQDTLPAGKRASCLLIGKEAIGIAKFSYLNKV